MFSGSICALGRYAGLVRGLPSTINRTSQVSCVAVESISTPRVCRQLSGGFTAAKDPLLQNHGNVAAEIFQHAHQDRIVDLENERNELRRRRDLFTSSNQERLDKLNRELSPKELKDNLKMLKEKIAANSKLQDDAWNDDQKLYSEIKELRDGIELIKKQLQSEHTHREQQSPTINLDMLLVNPDSYLQELKKNRDMSHSQRKTKFGEAVGAIEKRQSQRNANGNTLNLLKGEGEALKLIHAVTEQNGLNFKFFDLSKNPVSDAESLLAKVYGSNNSEYARGFIQALLNEELFRDNPEVFLKAWQNSKYVITGEYQDLLMEHFNIPLPALNWLLANNKENRKVVKGWQSSPRAARIIQITEKCQPLIYPFIRLTETIRMLWHIQINGLQRK